MFINAASPSLWHRAAERSIHLSHELFLGALHFRGGTRIRVVEAVQVEEAMRKIEPHFVLGGRPETPGLTPRRLGADKNLAVLEGDHIRWASFVKKTAMQFRHPAIGNENNAKFFEVGQDGGLWSAHPEGFLQHAFREILQRGQLNRNFPLPIEHRDRGHFC
jgi:hypothetical protein